MVNKLDLKGFLNTLRETIDLGRPRGCNSGVNFRRKAMNTQRGSIPSAWVWSHYKGSQDDNAEEVPLAWVWSQYSLAANASGPGLPAQGEKKLDSRFLFAAAAVVLLIFAVAFQLTIMRSLSFFGILMCHFFCSYRIQPVQKRSIWAKTSVISRRVCGSV